VEECSLAWMEELFFNRWSISIRYATKSNTASHRASDKWNKTITLLHRCDCCIQHL
jgi:hypothetical protein